MLIDRLKDQVEQIRKKEQSNPQEWNNIEQPLTNQHQAVCDVHNPKNPTAKQALKDANKLVDALDNLDAKHGPCRGGAGYLTVSPAQSGYPPQSVPGGRKRGPQGNQGYLQG